jgi:nucleotide-binding universal stress UspA family protein
MYQRILIATDGSVFANKGLEHGLALARCLGSHVTVVTVSEPILAGHDDLLGGLYSLHVEYGKAQDETARRILSEATATAEAMGLQATTLHVRDRQAAEGILETAHAHGSDLIVMASHGRRGMGRLLLGSQAGEVTTHSKVPVLVVR